MFITLTILGYLSLGTMFLLLIISAVKQTQR